MPESALFAVRRWMSFGAARAGPRVRAAKARCGLRVHRKALTESGVRGEAKVAAISEACCDARKRDA